MERIRNCHIYHKITTNPLWIALKALFSVFIMVIHTPEARSCAGGSSGGCSVVACVGSWSGWSACSCACGGGNQTRTYTITTPASCGGAECPAANGATENQSCNTTNCSITITQIPTTISTCHTGNVTFNRLPQNQTFGPSTASPIIMTLDRVPQTIQYK